MSSLRQDGFCAPAYGRGYVVKPDLSVVQVDFEEMVNIKHNPHARCDARSTLEESLVDALRGTLVDDDDWETGYDRADELMNELYYSLP